MRSLIWTLFSIHSIHSLSKLCYSPLHFPVILIFNNLTELTTKYIQHVHLMTFFFLLSSPLSLYPLRERESSSLSSLVVFSAVANCERFACKISTQMTWEAEVGQHIQGHSTESKWCAPVWCCLWRTSKLLPVQSRGRLQRCIFDYEWRNPIRLCATYLQLKWQSGPLCWQTEHVDFGC